MLSLPERAYYKITVMFKNVLTTSSRSGCSYLHYFQKRHIQKILQKNFKVGDLVLLFDHPTTRGQYPLSCMVEVFPSKKGVTHCVRVMTADANRLNNHLPCKRTILDRDSTKVALVEFPSVNPISEQLHLDPTINDDPECTGLWGSSLSDIV